jgi:hypothetical protein
MNLAETLDPLRLELLAGLEGVDRLVLGPVVLEHAAQVGKERDRAQVDDEDGYADEALDQDEPRAVRDRQQIRKQGRADLEQRDREADRQQEREDERPARELGFRLLVVLGRCVVRGDGQRAEADRERLAERDHAPDDRQPEEPVPLHHGLDRAADLGDLPVRLADRDGPVRGAAHHHAFEDGLPTDGG